MKRRRPGVPPLRQPDPGPWPNASQSLILNVALGGGPGSEGVSRSASEAVLDSIGDSRHGGLDPASERLVPLVWWRLDRTGNRDARTSALRASFAETWVRNQLLASTLAEVLGAFRADGIDAMPFKGSALAFSAYPHLGTRPMVDIDLLVRRSKFGEASLILESLGAHATTTDPDRRRALLHGSEFLFEKAVSPVAVDLHASVVWEGRRRDDDETWWDASVPLAGLSVPARTLCPADHLLVVCLQGLRWSQSRPIGWVADAVLLIEDPSQPIDWDRVVGQALRLRVAWSAAVALRFLARSFGARVPPEVVDALEAGHPTMHDRIEWACRSRPPAMARGMALHWIDHRRMTADASRAARLLSFLGYLRDLWALDRLRRMPAHAARRILRLPTR